MKPKKSDVAYLTDCPKTFDPWTVEPLMSVAFLDPLFAHNEISLTDAQPPISFPDLNLPLIRFNAEIHRDFDTGEAVDEEVIYSCSSTIFDTDGKPSTDNSSEGPSASQTVLLEICGKLMPSFNVKGGPLLKECFGNVPVSTADDVVEKFLALGSEEALNKYLPSDEELEPDESPKEVVEVEEQKEQKREKLDPETQALLEKRLRKPTDEKTSYSVLEDSLEKLPPLAELIPDPAFNWPFELDTFQKQAIRCLEHNQSVLVSAHTSAGKTVVAEYACAMCKRRGSRAIYTSPIKALSNQKFRDFRLTFGDDVGLLTGDIKVATKSSILVMTTEILHNMLCNSADTIHDLEVVIMDEVHYLNDKERGHVWEQLMIMLPQSVVLVLLSATLPNVLEFADWLGRIRGGTTIHVCQTYKRPVPLEHFLYTGCDTQTRSNLYLVVDKDGKFSREGYREAVDSLTKPKKVSKKGQDPGAVAAAGKSGENFDPSEIARMEAKQKPKSQYTGGKVNTPGRQTYKPKESEGYNRGNMTDTTVWTGLIRMLQERELTPVIVFCFSRAKITNLVHCLDSIDLLNKSEKNEVIVFLRAAIGNRLKACDKQLSQVLLVRSLAVRGIAIHHAGMLPLLKEVVELLFQRGLVRILFATETFAMGVNMPARCVIFTAIQKHDGNRRRPLTAGEYTQMAGRAGRRGLDSTGTVIIMSNNYEASVMPTDLQIQQMLLGQATKLTSQFKVTYSIILYLHRGNLQTPQELISRSFMYASDLRFERQWKRQLKYLQETVHSTTVHKPSSSHSLAPGVVSSKTAPVAISSGADDAVPLSYSQVRCPAHPLDSEASALSPCVGQIASYYLSCCRWRDLTYACAASSANQPLSALSKIFSPGRLLLLQLSTESVAPAAKSMSGASLGANAGSTCVPNWVTLGVVLDLTKASIDVVVSENSPIARSHVTLAILTWELPASPIADCTGAIGGSQAEEDVLESGELRHQAFTPFPPHLMPNYCPKSVEESKSRLVYVSEVPLTAVLAVFSNTVEVGNSKAYAETISNELTWFRQQQMASAEGCFVIHKKRGDSPDRKKQVCLLAATNEALFNCAQKRLSGGIEALPFWQHLGLEGPEVDEWTALTEELSRQPDASDGTHRLSSAPPPDCRDLVGHLSLAHRTTRRRWAIGRLSEKLKMNRGALLADYEARVFILEELGFLDKTTRSGCLTRKGMAACEFQQMEVLLAEVLFDGSITHLPPADIAALLSCFVCESGMGGGSSVPQGTNASLPLSNPLAPRVTIVNQEDINTPTSTQKHPLDEIPLPTVPEHLQSAVREMLKKADQLMRLQVEFQVDDPEADTRLNPALVGATYAWACGQPFSAIINLTTFAEGHLLRALQRLDELLRHVCNACRGLGDQALASRINDAHVAIHRDMVCAPSLYVAEELPLPPTNEHSVEV